MPWPFQPPELHWDSSTGEPDRTVRFDPDGPFGTWMGLDRSGPLPVLEPQPTLEERQERCEQMGLVFCNCKLDNGHVIVYNPTCPVHQHFCKL